MDHDWDELSAIERGTGEFLSGNPRRIRVLVRNGRRTADEWFPYGGGRGLDDAHWSVAEWLTEPHRVEVAR